MLFVENVDLMLKKQKALHEGWNNILSKKNENLTGGFLSVGSNSNSFENIKAAYKLLNRNGMVCFVSHLYETIPVGNHNVLVKIIPSFINCVFLILSEKNQGELMEIINQVECLLNRKKNLSKHSEIPIDIDLILFENKVFQCENQFSPHGDIIKYDHVLVPFCDLASEKIHPEYNKAMSSFIGKTEFKNIVKRFDVAFF